MPFTNTRSLKTNNFANYLQREPTQIGNRRKRTFSYWHRPVGTGLSDVVSLLYFAPPTDAILHTIGGIPNLVLNSYSDGSATFSGSLLENAWNHIVIWLDTANADAGQRVRMWLNAVPQTMQFAPDITLNYDSQWGIGGQREIVMRSDGTPGPDDQYDEVCHVDGQLLGPTYFANPDNTPKDLSGLSFGPDGYWLRFETGVVATFGADSSGNGNDFSALGGWALDDSIMDVPLPFGTVAGMNMGFGGVARYDSIISIPTDCPFN